MANDYYTRTFDVTPGTRITSQAIEDQFELVEQGLDKFPGGQSIHGGQGNFAVAGGATDVYTLALNALVTALSNGLTAVVNFPTALANLTTTPTINVNSLGAKSIVRQNGSAVAVGDLIGTVILSYNVTAGKFLQVSGAGLASETAAATSATNAATSATNASTSATNAATSATNAAASYDSFDDRYLGAKAADPTLDNDGAALITGALYYNTTASPKEMRCYNGATWDVTYSPGTSASQAEAEAGTEVALRAWSPLRVGQAIAAQVPYATQADQETATSTTKVVTSGRQQYHPSAAKAWLKCNAAGAVQASYNITSVTDTGPGIVDVTIATDFSSADYAVAGTALHAASTLFITLRSQAAGTFQAASYDAAGSFTDPTNYFLACFGDQA